MFIIYTLYTYSTWFSQQNTHRYFYYWYVYIYIYTHVQGRLAMNIASSPQHTRTSLTSFLSAVVDVYVRDKNLDTCRSFVRLGLRPRNHKVLPQVRIAKLAYDSKNYWVHGRCQIYRSSNMAPKNQPHMDIILGNSSNYRHLAWERMPLIRYPIHKAHGQ